MSTQQPNWEFVANLGDVNVADYGGFIVYRDTTGVYAPEVELYEPDYDTDNAGGTAYRFILEFSPKEWFADKLSEVASSSGQDADLLLQQLQSGDPLKMACAYHDIVGHFGPDEFDSYPVRLTEDEAQARYANVGRT